MPSDIGVIFAAIGFLLALAGLAPFLRAADQKAQLAKAIATAQDQEFRINALTGQRDDLRNEVDRLTRRVDALEAIVAKYDDVIGRRAIRDD